MVPSQTTNTNNKHILWSYINYHKFISTPMPTTQCWNSLPPSWVVAYQALRCTWYWIYSGSQPHGFDSEVAVPLDVSSAPTVIFGDEERETLQVNLEALRVYSRPPEITPSKLPHHCLWRRPAIKPLLLLSGVILMGVGNGGPLIFLAVRTSWTRGGTTFLRFIDGCMELGYMLPVCK